MVVSVAEKRERPALINSTHADLAVTEKTAGYSTRGMVRDFLILASLVNISYLRVWSELLTVQPKDRFWMTSIALPADYLAGVLGVLGITAILWTLAVVTRYRFRGWAHRVAFMVFVCLALIPAVTMRDVLVAYYPATFDFLRAPLLHALKSWWLRGAILIALPVVFRIAVRYRRRMIRILARGFLVSSPFVVMTFGNALWKASLKPIASAPETTAPFLPTAPGSPRVVWVILDEWDYRLTFTDRKADLSLPNVDRLAAESFFARNATPPAQQTALSMPSFIDGRRVVESEPENATTLWVRYAGTNERVLWGSRSNLFSKALEAGFNAAVVGWYMPYCKVFGGVLSSCSWLPMEAQADTTGDTLASKVVNQARSIVETRTISPFGQSLCTKQRMVTYFGMMDNAKAVATDPRVGLTLLHLPVPHSPHAYDRHTGQFTLANHPISGYIDSLALLDRTIADLRAALERAGMWDSTTLVFSADHPFRSSTVLDGKSDPRIPFVVKVAGQKTQVAYDRPFNTVVTADLLLAILSGEVKDGPSVAFWMDQHLRKEYR